MPLTSRLGSFNVPPFLSDTEESSVPDPPPLVDIHCHLLPEIDDGAADWAETLAMARLAVADGVSTIIATPHQLGGYTQNHGSAIRDQTTRLLRLLRQNGVPLRVLPGADVRIEPEMIAGLQSGEVLTLADCRRHVLLELPHEFYFPLDRLVSDLRVAGMVGILSHPERNLGILRNRHVVRQLVDAGCLMQVTAGSLVGAFGQKTQEFSRWLVQQQLVHFLATDAHGATSRRPLLRRAFDCVARLVGEPTAVDLCCRNPAMVVAGKMFALSHSAPRRSRLADWFRRKRAA